jgi:tetratricopeptide (TPR) repeat protein
MAKRNSEKQKNSMPEFKLAALLTLKVPELIGFEAEVKKIERAVDVLESQRGTTFFHVSGIGGIGKTFLLNHVRERLLETHSDVFVTPIIDLYDIAMHSAIDLIERIAVSLMDQCTTKQKQYFTDFQAKMNDFRSQQGGGLTKDRDAVQRTFDEACAKLVKDKTGKNRIVVLVDTGELLEYHHDEVQDEFDLKLQMRASSRSWLSEAVKDDTVLPRTLLVVAGRPYPEAAFKELNDLAGTDDRRIELKGMDEATVLKYFRALEEALGREIDQAKKRAKSKSERESQVAHGELATYEAMQAKLAGLDEAKRSLIGKIADGLPVSLALAAQLYLDEYLNLDNQVAIVKTDLRQARKKLRDAMVSSLSDYNTFGDASLPMQYLALMRKGMTKERLQAVWRSSKNEPMHDESYCEEVIEFLKRQTFVKQLVSTHNGKSVTALVLHDEIGDWCEEGFFNQSEEAKRDIYARILKRYDHEIEEDERGIASQGEQALDLRRHRRTLAIERMFYALRANPAEGYKIYYELAEEAFSADLPEFDAQLRAEFLQWWNRTLSNDPKTYRYRKEAEAANVSSSLVKADLATRWVQRQYNAFEKDGKLKTIELADRFLKELRRTLSAADRITLEVYRNVAQTFLTLKPKDAARIRAEFAMQIETLKRDADRSATDLNNFLMHDTLALAHYMLGFIERRLGLYDEAINNYTQSIGLYRELNFDLNQARSLNDRAFAQAQVGDLDDAELSAQDALKIRLRIGFPRTIGWSYNTVGIVYSLSQRPATAIDHCSRALQIFQRLDQRRNEMQALRALAEAHRRDAELRTATPDVQKSKLLLAVQTIEQANKIAVEFGVDRSDRSDILDEYGSARRDLALFYRNNPELGKPNDAQKERKAAQKLFEESIDLVSEEADHLKYRLVDPMINLAYLEDGFDNEAEARKLTREALNKCPPELRQLSERSYHDKRDAFWIQLSKAHALLARMAGRRLKSLVTESAAESQIESVRLEFVDEAIYALYYASKLRDVRVAQRSKRTVYEQLCNLPNPMLRKMQEDARAANRRLQVTSAVDERLHLNNFIFDKFGVGV